MKKAILAFVAAAMLAVPAVAAEADLAKARAQLVEFIGEAIAIDSVCPGLILHAEYIWITLNQVKIDFDELLPEAGAKSSGYIEEFARLGVPEVCRRGVEFYGPQGSKAANMLTLPR